MQNKKQKKKDLDKNNSKKEVTKWKIITVILTIVGLFSGFYASGFINESRHFIASKFGVLSDFSIEIKDFDSMIYSNKNESFILFITNNYRFSRYVDINFKSDKDSSAYYFVPEKANSSFNNIKIEGKSQELIKVIMITKDLKEIENDLIVTAEDSTNMKNKREIKRPFKVSSIDS